MIKRYLFASILVGSLFQLAVAQTHERITVAAGEDLSKTLASSGTYRFPSFTQGIIFFQNGKKISASLNYNVLSGQMQFVGEKGDTLIIGNPETIDHIMIGDNKFFYNKGYIEAIAGNDVVKLGKKQKIKLESEKVGGYGESATTASVDNFQNFYSTSNNGTYALVLNQNTVVVKDISYFWIGNNAQIVPATEDNLFKFVNTDKKTNVEEYVKQSRINFHIEKDLVKVLQYSLN